MVVIVLLTVFMVMLVDVSREQKGCFTRFCEIGSCSELYPFGKKLHTTSSLTLYYRKRRWERRVLRMQMHGCMGERLEAIAGYRVSVIVCAVGAWSNKAEFFF